MVSAKFLRWPTNRKKKWTCKKPLMLLHCKRDRSIEKKMKINANGEKHKISKQWQRKISFILFYHLDIPWRDWEITIKSKNTFDQMNHDWQEFWHFFFAQWRDEMSGWCFIVSASIFLSHRIGGVRHLTMIRKMFFALFIRNRKKYPFNTSQKQFFFSRIGHVRSNSNRKLVKFMFRSWNKSLQISITS